MALKVYLFKVNCFLGLFILWRIILAFLFEFYFIIWLLLKFDLKDQFSISSNNSRMKIAFAFIVYWFFYHLNSIKHW